jgi:hypothetical protein
MSSSTTYEVDLDVIIVTERCNRKREDTLISTADPDDDTYSARSSDCSEMAMRRRPVMEVAVSLQYTNQVRTGGHNEQRWRGKRKSQPR